MEQTISRQKSIWILVGTTILMLVLGNVIGYTFFWDRYDKTSSGEKKVSLLEEQAIINPKDEANQLDLAWTYYQQEKYDQAKELFDQLIQQNKDNFEAKNGLASSYIGLQQYAEAERILIQLQVIDPENDELFHDLGIALREQNRLSEAEKTLQAGLQINKVSAGMHYDLALVYERMKNNKAAIVHYKKSIDLVPNYEEPIEGLKRMGIEGYQPSQYH